MHRTCSRPSNNPYSRCNCRDKNEMKKAGMGEGQTPETHDCTPATERKADFDDRLCCSNAKAELNANVDIASYAYR